MVFFPSWAHDMNEKAEHVPKYKSNSLLRQNDTSRFPYVVRYSSGWGKMLQELLTEAPFFWMFTEQPSCPQQTMNRPPLDLHTYNDSSTMARSKVASEIYHLITIQAWHLSQQDDTMSTVPSLAYYKTVCL